MGKKIKDVIVTEDDYCVKYEDEDDELEYDDEEDEDEGYGERELCYYCDKWVEPEFACSSYECGDADGNRGVWVENYICPACGEDM